MVVRQRTQNTGAVTGLGGKAVTAPVWAAGPTGLGGRPVAGPASGAARSVLGLLGSQLRRGVQVRFVSRAELGWLTVVIRDQTRAAGAVEVRVPGPCQVAGGLGVHPVGEAVDVGTGAVVLADLSRDERHLRDHWSDLVRPASLGAAGVEVVG